MKGVLVRILSVIAALVLPIAPVTADNKDWESLARDAERAYAHARCAAIAVQTGSENAEDLKRAHLRAGYGLYRKAVPGAAILGRATIGASEQEGSAFSYGEHYVLERNVVEQSDIASAIKHVPDERRSEAWRSHAQSMYRRANCSLLLK
jgi:hypothetical protein